MKRSLEDGFCTINFSSHCPIGMCLYLTSQKSCLYFSTAGPGCTACHLLGLSLSSLFHAIFCVLLPRCSFIYSSPPQLNIYPTSAESTAWACWSSCQSSEVPQQNDSHLFVVICGLNYLANIFHGMSRSARSKVKECVVFYL